MIFFTFKVIVAALIIAFSSWLSGIYPKLAGFIKSLIAILFSYYEYKDVDRTVTFTKSILVAIPVSYLFFLFFSKSLGMNFYLMYGLGILIIVVI